MVTSSLKFSLQLMELSGHYCTWTCVPDYSSADLLWVGLLPGMPAVIVCCRNSPVNSPPLLRSWSRRVCSVSLLLGFDRLVGSATTGIIPAGTTFVVAGFSSAGSANLQRQGTWTATPHRHLTEPLLLQVAARGPPLQERPPRMTIAQGLASRFYVLFCMAESSLLGGLW